MDPFETLLRETISDLKYRDWEFRLEKDGIGLWYLQIRFVHAGIVWTGRKWRLSIYMTRGEIVQTALKAVLTAEEHEARARFMFRDRAIFGPHLSVERLWELAGDRTARETRS